MIEDNVLHGFLDKLADDALKQIKKDGILSQQNVLPFLIKDQYSKITHMESEFLTRKDFKSEMMVVEARMDRLDSRLDQLDGRMNQFDSRMDHLENRMDHLETRIDELDKKIDDTRLELIHYMNERFRSVESTLRIHTAILISLLGTMVGLVVAVSVKLLF
jgi:chromosome segregation ATPase